jgi:hypothetical protein
LGTSRQESRASHSFLQAMSLPQKPRHTSICIWVAGGIVTLMKSNGTAQPQGTTQHPHPRQRATAHRVDHGCLPNGQHQHQTPAPPHHGLQQQAHQPHDLSSPDRRRKQLLVGWKQGATMRGSHQTATTNRHQPAPLRATAHRVGCGC